MENSSPPMDQYEAKKKKKEYNLLSAISVLLCTIPITVYIMGLMQLISIK